MNKDKERRKKLERKTYATVIAILFVFGATSVIGSIAGNWLDTKYDMEPTGSIIALAISYIISWAVAGTIAYRFLNNNKK